MRVAVLAGGRSSEHDVSLASGAAIAKVLTQGGHDVRLVTVERCGRWKCNGESVPWVPGAGVLDAEVVFPALHGPFGEDGTVQGLLELLDVAYVGSGVLASSLCMDKVLFKDLIAATGIDQVQYLGLDRSRWIDQRPAVIEAIKALGLPVFVKPARMGSSIGISKVTNSDQLAQAIELAFEFDSSIVIEQYCDGLEVECSVLGLDDPIASLPGEIVIKSAEWYDYETKYTEGQIELKVPARIASDVLTTVQQLACDIFKRVGCAGMARADFFICGDKVLVNELNTIPGFTATSGFASMFAASGIEFNDICEQLLKFALERFERGRSHQSGLYASQG